jgi:outer membrane protein insertion porin family
VRSPRPLASLCHALALCALASTLALAAGCIASAKLRPDQEGHLARSVRRIVFSGNHHVSNEDLLSGMQLAPEHGSERVAFEPGLLEIDVKGIEHHYNEHGYYQAHVVSALARTVGLQVDVFIVIEEGEPSHFGDVVIKGAPGGDGLDAASLRELFGIRTGEIADHDRYMDGKHRIGRRLVAHGYLFAQIVGHMVFRADGKTADITLELEPKALVHFGKSRVEGVKSIPESAVRGRLAWDEGDIYDAERVALTEKRLSLVDRLASARIDFDEADQGKRVDLTVHVTEASRYEERGGFGFGFDKAHSEVRGRGSLLCRGCGFPMTTLRADATVAYSFLLKEGRELGWGVALGATAAHEDFLLPRLRLVNEIDYSQQVAEAYELRGPRSQQTLDRAFLAHDQLRLGVGWQWRYQEVVAVSDAVSPEYQQALGLVDGHWLRVAAFVQSLAYDARDNPLDTRSGYYLELRLEEGGPYAGGAFDYLLATPEARGYWPISENVMLAARGRLGWSVERSGALPITQRFFAGGPSSQRGFGSQRLSPVATGASGTTVPIGGEGLIETSVEARFDDVVEPLGLPLGFALFVDGADVTAHPQDLSWPNQHWAVGMGLRVRTPVGPLRLDAGLRLTRTGAGEPEPGSLGSISFGLGDSF